MERWRGSRRRGRLRGLESNTCGLPVAGRECFEAFGDTGLRGAFGLADAETGRQLFITRFDSREAIEAAEPMFDQMGDEIAEEIRGRRVAKDYYEVVLGVVQLT